MTHSEIINTVQLSESIVRDVISNNQTKTKDEIKELLLRGEPFAHDEYLVIYREVVEEMEY